MYNRCVKINLKIPIRLGKNVRKPQGGGYFFDSHCRLDQTTYPLVHLNTWQTASQCVHFVWTETVNDLNRIIFPDLLSDRRSEPIINLFTLIETQKW